MTVTTERDGAKAKAVPDALPIRAVNAEARPARTRVKASLVAVTDRCVGFGRHWLAQARETWDGLWEISLAEQHPASPRELRAYIHSAAWVPGDVPLLEGLGRVYGYIVALPVSLALYTLAWLLQRPGRALVTAIVTTVVWFTAR